MATFPLLLGGEIMATFSLCMIVKNEEEVIERCLESVNDIVDEIVIVDTGSTEQTKEIVKKFTDQIYDFEWIDDFSAARNYSFSKATMEYILWLDADDIILEEDRIKLKELKNSIDPSVSSVMMKYNYAFDEFGNVTLCFSRERLVKRSKNPKWIDPIHEYIKIDGNKINSDISITHKRVHNDSDRNLRIFEKMIAEGKKFSARNLFYFAKELYYHDKIADAIVYFNKFIDLGDGWVEDIINACYHMALCYSRIGNKKERVKILLKSFEYGLPRAEISCQLGNYYFEEKDYNKAIFWYELATNLKKPENSLGFIRESYWGYIPNIQLCVCYYRLGNIDMAIKYNEKASEYKPKARSVLYNKRLFKNRKPNAEKTETKLMKIVQVAPDIFTLPPTNYGGIEKMVYEITEELSRRGHEVYLYAPKGTTTSANLIEYEHNKAWNDKAIREFVTKTLPKGIDIIHDHTHHSVIGKENLEIPTVCTIHCTVNNDVKYPVYVSEKALERYGGYYGERVYNGINIEEYEYSEEKNDYLLFLGALRPWKGVHHALDVAIRTNHKLIVAGPITNGDYFENEISPIMRNNSNIVYVGAVGGKEKQDLLKHAKYVMFPSIYEEPFGLVMIEALACGTPVLALAKGAVPEVLEGFPQLICKSIDEMVDKVLNQSLPDPKTMRKYVTKRFSTQTMVDDYIQIYKEIMKKTLE